MSTKENSFEIGDLVKFRGGYTNLALVIEKTHFDKSYRIKWCRNGETIWVWEDTLTLAY